MILKHKTLCNYIWPLSGTRFSLLIRVIVFGHVSVMFGVCVRAKCFGLQIWDVVLGSAFGQQQAPEHPHAVQLYELWLTDVLALATWLKNSSLFFVNTSSFHTNTFQVVEKSPTFSRGGSVCADLYLPFSSLSALSGVSFVVVEVPPN